MVLTPVGKYLHTAARRITRETFKGRLIMSAPLTHQVK